MAAPQPLDLPPAATPYSILDNSPAPPYFSSQHGYYAPQTQHATEHASPERSRTVQINAPQNKPHPAPADRAETASIASTILPPYSSSARHAHKSEAEYLAALRSWAEERQWVELDGQGGLQGFYGDECLEDRSKRMKAERQASKDAKAREKARKASLVEAREGGERRKGSISNWLGRQRRGGDA